MPTFSADKLEQITAAVFQGAETPTEDARSVA